MGRKRDGQDSQGCGGAFAAGRGCSGEKEGIEKSKPVESGSKEEMMQKAVVNIYRENMNFALQMIDTIRVESEMDDGKKQTFIQTMPKHKLPSTAE